MRIATRVTTMCLVVAGGTALAAARSDAPDARGMRFGAAPVQSLGAMTFGPDGTLFIADPRGAALFAFDPSDKGTATYGEQYLSRDIDQKVAAALGTTRDRVRFNDMAVNPISHNIFLTVSRVDGDTKPALIRLSGSDAVEVVDLSHVKFATTPLPEAPSPDGKTPWGQPQWTLSVTHMAFADGELLVAGLSNEQFASALRRVPFPFSKAASINTVEIYHTSHNKWETAAPIEAFVPITIGGTPMIVAGYGCSPIATFKRADLASTKHLRGRTVAELGGGNRPIDIIRYQRDGKEWILVANSHRTLMRIDPSLIAAAPEMTKPVSQAYEPGGVTYLPVASAGVMQIDDFNSDFVAVLQRDIESGAVNLMALQKRWL
ncbi:MAG: hypothetical protein ABI647_22855 [Gemmatimonadota bacterium]